MEYRGNNHIKKSRRRRFWEIPFLSAAMLLCLSGCGREAEERTPEEIPLAQGESQSREIPVDFPFYESEEVTLTLVPSKEAAGEYALMFYDEDGQLLQQIPCGSLTEPVTFSFDGIAYGSWTDLEIFSADSDTGLLFLWEDNRFSENPIQIPRYEEIHNRAMLTVTESGEIQEKRIYQLNEFRERAEEVRSWSLNRDSGMLRIWDSLRQQSLFEGEVVLDEEGQPLNREYYEYLFWEDLNLLWNYSADPVIRVWRNEKREEGNDAQGLESFETVQNKVFGNLGHTAEYESRQAFLESCGYAGEAPIYQYYDRFQNLQLELYLDEENQKYYGVSYLNRINCDGKNVADLFGFTVSDIGEGQWEEGQAFSLLSVNGTSGKSTEEGYREYLEYTKSGKPDYFLSQDLMEYCGVETLGNLVEINFIYRENGTLFCRDYHHDALTFGSTLCGMDSFFDEKERPVYETGYITHGFCEYYYIYEDEGEKPAYRLFLDYNGGYAIPSMVRFR